MARILVVDDDPALREVLEEMLAQWGHTVVTAQDGVEAIERFVGEGADLILSDVMMPRMNGLDLLRNLEARIRGHVPFVLLTSYTAGDAVEAAIYAGAFDYIPKPFDGPKVRDVVDRALASVPHSGSAPAR